MNVTVRKIRHPKSILTTLPDFAVGSMKKNAKPIALLRRYRYNDRKHCDVYLCSQSRTEPVCLHLNWSDPAIRAFAMDTLLLAIRELLRKEQEEAANG